MHAWKSNKHFAFGCFILDDATDEMYSIDQYSVYPFCAKFCHAAVDQAVQAGVLLNQIHDVTSADSAADSADHGAQRNRASQTVLAIEVAVGLDRQG